MSVIGKSRFDEPGLCFRTTPSVPVVPLHPAIRSMLDAEVAGPSFEALHYAEFRAVREAVILGRPTRHEPVGSIEDRTLSGPAGEIPVRVYRPAGRVGSAPIVAYFHGGGWVLGTLDTHDDVCRTLVNRSGVLLVSVGYRRAPEHRFPVPLEDCVAAVRWCALRGAEIGAAAWARSSGGAPAW